MNHALFTVFTMKEILDKRERLLYVIGLTGMKQAEFAKRVGVSAAAISQRVSLTGRNSDISEELADKIVSAFPDLNISMQWMLTGTDSSRAADDDLPSLFDYAHDARNEVTASDNSLLHEPNRQVESTVTNSGNPVYSSSARTGATHRGDATRSQARQDEVPAERFDNASPSESNLERRAQGETLRSATNGEGETYIHAHSSVTALKPGRTLKRIVMFYTDGTFEEFTPQD